MQSKRGFDMALKFEISAEAFDALEESQKGLYDKHGDGYRLQVEGIDPADELKEALRKEREEKAESKRKLKEYESDAEKRERERLEKQQEWEQLSKTDKERADRLEREIGEMRDTIANEKRTNAAASVVNELTRDTARARLLQKEAMPFITHTPDGIKINGPDGDAWDAKKLSDYLSQSYPFLVDGNQSSGGGATGGKGGGAVNKKFVEMNGAELSALRKEDPQAYERLRKDYHGS
jgi:hypothetical protein